MYRTPLHHCPPPACQRCHLASLLATASAFPLSFNTPSSSPSPGEFNDASLVLPPSLLISLYHPVHSTLPGAHTHLLPPARMTVPSPPSQAHPIGLLHTLCVSIGLNLASFPPHSSCSPLALRCRVMFERVTRCDQAQYSQRRWREVVGTRCCSSGLGHGGTQICRRSHCALPIMEVRWPNIVRRL